MDSDSYEMFEPEDATERSSLVQRYQDFSVPLSGSQSQLLACGIQHQSNRLNQIVTQCY